MSGGYVVMILIVSSVLFIKFLDDEILSISDVLKEYSECILYDIPKEMYYILDAVFILSDVIFMVLYFICSTTNVIPGIIIIQLIHLILFITISVMMSIVYCGVSMIQ